MSERVPAGGAYRAAVGLHEPLSVEHLRAARHLLSIYCRTANPFCSKYLDLVRRASLLVARARIEDLSSDSSYSGIDEGVIRALERLVDFYSNLIAGIMVTVGEYVLVKARATVIGGGADLVEGEVSLVPIDRAATLYVAGLVEPVKSAAAVKPGEEPPGGGSGRDNV